MDLKEYKKKIANLSVNEKKLRDLYLRDLALGKVQGPPTGYASIDKPWLKYYREQPIKEIKLEQTIYDLVFDQEDMNSLALGYLGTSWTYKKLKRKVDKAADSFKKMGVTMGDVVLVGVSNSPETIITVLALNKIGAVSKWFDLRASSHDIEEYANFSECKFAVVFDIIVPKIKEVVDKTSLEKIIVMSPAGALGSFKQYIYDIGNIRKGTYIPIPDDKRFLTFKKFMSKGRVDDSPSVGFDASRPTLMIQSSGTTGKPKTIVHSDASMINCTRAIAYSDLPLGKGKKVLVALPPWIAYGLGDAMLLPMALGSKVDLCPNFDPDSIFNNVGKFTISYAAPFHYRYLRDHYDELSVEQKSALTKVECMITGGDKISVEENKAFEELFGTIVVNGYGNNEGFGALTVNPVNHNKYGTVGIPKYDEIIISFDPDTKEELLYGQIGEICSLTKTAFLEYEKNPEATSEVNKMHNDGCVWLHTGDLGYVDSDGYINLSGRARRVITRLGFKISAYTIEDNISSNPFVKECVAVSVKDEVEEHVPMAFVVLNDEYCDKKDEMLELITKNCNRKLKEYEIPKYFKIVDSLPYTPNGKYDFVSLEKIGNEYVASLDKPVNKQLKKTIL